MNNKNSMMLELKSVSRNEGLARSTVAAFCLELGPTIEEINDIKTAVSEAVTNCIVHAYEGSSEQIIRICCMIIEDIVSIEIIDTGKGIADIDQARQAFFTTKADEERSGMGFTVMESFMDNLDVTTNISGGTTVRMQKKLGRKE